MEMYRTVYSSESSLYEKYERQRDSKYNRVCIDGSVTGCGRCVGYCQFNGHPGFLTEKHLKQRNCIKKDCNYYIAKPNKQKSQVTVQPDKSSLIFSLAQQQLAENEGVRIMRVENKEFNKYVIFFITITNDYSFQTLSSLISIDGKVEIEYIRLDYDFDTCVALVMES